MKMKASIFLYGMIEGREKTMKWFWLGVLLFCLCWFVYGVGVSLYRLWVEQRVDGQALILALGMAVMSWRAWDEWRGNSWGQQENRRRP
ncbi:Conserved hypothetical protein [Geobacillus thermodenitrificans NG80-2]|jgi:high-affinity Fe2+/Pb2+ permease|uniref:Uncharacterized protein n=3 Tax=Anoxybacillaceae TaxID=3120669 RepID=A4INK2_GEOTN|nr:Conserved hypothetical protein [Geobacillus thermodenitrificans NG80-2]